MADDFSAPPEPRPPAPAVGLPPVQPPSGKFIVQLFLVPGLIVGAIVVVFLGFTWMFGGPRSPAAILKKLDEGNADVRWRTASDLAQTLRRDPRLASDPDFALQLALRLRRALADAESGERALAARMPSLGPDERRKERKPFQDERSYSVFLCGCLGNFVVPAGVPELKEVAVREGPAEPMASALLRRQAVWGLANAGENLKKFDALPEPDQLVVLAALDRAADNAAVADWARATRAYLDARRAKRPDAFGVDVVLERCADSDDPVLRLFVAFAANFWSGTAEQDRRIDAVLLKLAYDDGRGEKEAAEWFADNPDESVVQAVCLVPGLEVRLNALLALARRGSDRFPADTLAQLLDADALRKSFIVKKADGAEAPDEAKVATLAGEAKKAMDQLEEKRPGADTAAVRAAAERIEKTRKDADPAPTGLGLWNWALLVGLMAVLVAFVVTRARRPAPVG